MQNDLADELERLIEAFHDGLPDGQGETGDGGVAGRALCQFVYDQADDIAKALRCPVPADVADLVERFSEPFDGMLSEIIQCHQLRKSAAIMDAQTKRETGWADTSDRAEHMRKAAGTIEALALLTTLASGRDEWLPIETAPMWVVAVVTDGERAAVAQRAENDWGGAYWAVDPEDGLDWEPTHYRTLPQGDQQ